MTFAQKNLLWPVDLVSQVVSIVVSMTAIMLLLPFVLSGRPGFAAITYSLNGALAIIMLVNVFMIIGRWQRTKQRVSAMSVYHSQVLAHWRYDQKTWRAYAESERRYAHSYLARWTLPGLIIGLSVVYLWLQLFGQQVLSPLLTAGSVNLLVLLVKTGLLPYYRVLNTPSEAIITPDGLCIGGGAYFWRQGNAKLCTVNLQQGQPSMLVFNLRVQNGRTTSTQSVRIPVPVGCAAEAATVVDALTPQ